MFAIHSKSTSSSLSSPTKPLSLFSKPAIKQIVTRKSPLINHTNYHRMRSRHSYTQKWIAPYWLQGTSLVASLQCRRSAFDPWFGKIPWRRAWQPTPVFLPGESPWTEEPGGYRPWGHKESDITKWLSTQAHIYYRTKQYLIFKIFP